MDVIRLVFTQRLDHILVGAVGERRHVKLKENMIEGAAMARSGASRNACLPAAEQNAHACRCAAVDDVVAQAAVVAAMSVLIQMWSFSRCQHHQWRSLLVPHFTKELCCNPGIQGGIGKEKRREKAEDNFAMGIGAQQPVYYISN